MQAAFLEEAERAIEVVRYDPGNLMPVAEPSEGGQPFWVRDRVGREAARAGIGLALGVAATVGVNLTLSSLPAPLPVIISVLALAIGLVLGYSASENLIRPPLPSRPTPANVTPPEPRPASIRGWPDFEQHIVAWFRKAMASQALPPGQELERLARAFGVARTD
jgi:hypothetical protein